MIFLILFGAIFWLVIITLVIRLICLIIYAAFKGQSKDLRRRIKVNILAIVGVVGSVVALDLYLSRPYVFDPKCDDDLGKAYQFEFGVLPPVEVTVLKAQQWQNHTRGGQWLLLDVTPKQLDHYIAMDFQPAAAIPGALTALSKAHAPRWWQPQKSSLNYYVNTNWSKTGGWRSSEAAIGIDRASNLVWFVTAKSY